MMERVQWAGFSPALLWFLVLFAPPAFATHEVDHRFIVHGTVRDGQGRPVPDAKVIVVASRLNEGMTAFTDRNGRYEALLHLHNSDLGDEIIVTAMDQRKSIRVEFDPNDLSTPRGAEVDFGPSTDEAQGSKAFWRSPVFGGALVGIGTAALIYWVWRIRAGKRPGIPKKGKKGR